MDPLPFDGKRFNSAPPGANLFTVEPWWLIEGMLIELMFAVVEVTPFPFIKSFCKFPGCVSEVN